MRFLTMLALAVLLAAPALAETHTADFENGTNVGGWAFGGPSDVLNSTGGNPGGWLGTSVLYTFAPIFQCDSGAEYFTADYISKGVTRISGDFRTDFSDNDWANTYNFTVVLRNNNGTPDNVEDDLYVYPDPFNNVIPPVGGGWTHYDFVIPSDFVGGPGELPAGWLGGSYLTGTDWFPEDRSFQEVMANVTDVEFWWIHPGFMAIIGEWAAGADNITIEYDNGTVATEAATLDALKAIYR